MMRRHTNTNNNEQQNREGERQLSAAARAAMARESGQSPAKPSYYATTRRKIKSFFYRLYYGSIISSSGNPSQQNDKAKTLFAQSFVGCALCVYLPLMVLSYMLVNYNYASTPNKNASMEKLQHHSSFDHGSFFFGSTSHEMMPIRKNSVWNPSWNPTQQKMLNDEDINIEVEKERCGRYDLGYTDQTMSRRRRLFLGALIADDSMEVLQAVSTEAYNIFHTVSFVEANITHVLSPRSWKFGLQSENLLKLQQMFGPKSKVSVDYYVSYLSSTEGNDLLKDALQREGNNVRWKMNGMRPEDVAIVASADETFSRDFLRALQICDFPEFRPGQTCNGGKVQGSTLVYEGSPNCVARERRLVHLDAMLGECVDQIGDASSRHSATDIREDVSRASYLQKDGSAAGYHFHNFFMNASEIRLKHVTYGEDLVIGAHCAHGSENEEWLDFARGSGTTLPIFYVDEKTRTARHVQWKNIVIEDEEWRKGNMTEN